MTADSLGGDNREQQLNAILCAWYEAAELDQPPAAAEFIARHPEFTVELQNFLSGVGKLQNAMAGLAGSSGTDATCEASPSLPWPREPGTTVRYFGEYELLEVLGSGGMGVVYKARQLRLRKLIALKMIRSGQLASADELRRFEAEAKAAARLDHVGIVPVHEVGEHAGCHFYTMDLVPGGNLSQLYRESPVPSRRAAEILQQLACAVHYAHQQGIVHRDLKPANVLLTSSGAPRITDFGLAKRLWADPDSAAHTVTESGQILGTAGYMSPEQAAGMNRLVGPPADIYCLGAILYALVTGRAPFAGESPAGGDIARIGMGKVRVHMVNRN